MSNTEILKQFFISINSNFLKTIFSSCFDFKASQADKTLSKLYKIGQKKLEKRLNIENVLRDIEDLKFVAAHYRHS